MHSWTLSWCKFFTMVNFITSSVSISLFRGVYYVKSRTVNVRIFHIILMAGSCFNLFVIAILFFFARCVEFLIILYSLVISLDSN